MARAAKINPDMASTKKETEAVKGSGFSSAVLTAKEAKGNVTFPFFLFCNYESMIDGDIFPKQQQPLPLRCSRGRLRMKLFDFDEVEFSEVEGTFAGLSRSRYNGFPYWELRLVDESNQIRVLFPLTSGLFVRLLRLLVGRKFRFVEICLNPNAEEKVFVLLDGVQVSEPAKFELPKIKKLFTMKNRRVVEYHDYSERNAEVERLVEAVNAYNPRR